MSQLGVLISSDNFNGQTGKVLFKNFSDQVIDLGYQTLPFVYSPEDGVVQGLYFIYFSSTSETCLVVIGQPNPSPTPTPTPTMTPSPSPDNGVVFSYINPGSVVIDYVVSLEKIFSGDVSFGLVQKLSFDPNVTEYIVTNYEFLSGSTSGTTQVVLSGQNFNNIVRNTELEFFDVNPSGFVLNAIPIFASATPTVTPTNTPTPTISETPTQTPTSTVTPTQTPTPTISETPTQTPTPTISETPTQTPTPTVTDTPTQTPTPTVTDTPTQTPTPTISETPTQTPTPTISETPTQTPTNTPTETPTETPTQTPTESPTQTPTPTSTPAVPVTTNIVLYYDPSNLSSYPGSGTTINDLSGNGLNGSLSNITFTSPYFTYNGTSSQVSVADNVLLEPGSGDWTMEVWVNQSVSGNDVVLGKFDFGGLSQDVSYSIRTTSTTYYAQYGSGSGSGPTLFANSTSYVGTLNTWYQLVYVFTNVASNTIETFVNGVSIGTVSHSLASILNTTTGLYIGSYNNGEYPQWFDGRIGITRLYNKSLTASEVLQNFNADKSKYGL